MEKPVTSKACSRCGKTRPANQYRIIRSRKTGKTRLHSWCMQCQSEYMALKWEATDTPERRKSEAKRVRTYQKDPKVAARRSARSGAQYRALAALRKRHPDEYENLRIRIGATTGKNYAALAALREAHRDEYQQLYDDQVRSAGLELA
jgi:hypothetical protein